MAEPLARLQHVPESVLAFNGVVLRKDRLSLAEGDVARAINCDLHTQVGTALRRRGRIQVYLLASGLARVRLQQTFESLRYAIAGTVLYRQAVVLLTGLSNRLRTSLAAMRPLTDPQTYVFIADSSGMKKEALGAVTTWGIAAPTATPVLAAGASPGLSGLYTVSYTYVRKVGTAVAHESNPSPSSAGLTVTNAVISVSGLTASADAQVTHKRVYRTVNGGSSRLLDQEITNATTTATLSVTDTGLGAIVAIDNAPPPVSGVMVFHQEHLFMLDDANPNYLWWSKRFRPESVPGTNFVQIGSANEPLIALASLVGLLGVFTAKTKYRVLGNDTSGFVAQEALSSRGTAAPQAVLVTEKGCCFVARDGLFLTNFVQEDDELSQLIAPLFEGETINDYLPINWDAADTMSLAYWKSRLYFAYPSGTSPVPDMVAVYSWHTRQWFFYEMAADALYTEEDTDQVLAGLRQVITGLEQGDTDLGVVIPLVLEPAARYVRTGTVLARASAYLRKRFDYLRVDGDAGDGTLACDLFIDDVLQQRLVSTGSRPRGLRRLQGKEGFTWRVRLTSTGTVESVSGIEMQAVILEPH